jgi:hypothetical protein
MRGYNFFTSIELDANDCLQELKNVIKNVKMNGENGILIDGKSRSYLWFSNDTVQDFFLSSEEKESLLQKIGLQNPCITDFQTHRSADLKRVIAALAELCPDLHIYDDGDFVGSAQEYLNASFDY